jgi:hypothetical protein
MNDETGYAMMQASSTSLTISIPGFFCSIYVKGITRLAT